MDTNSEAPTPPTWHPSKGDQYKALCDYLKHMATLSAGSILLVVTMLEKMFAQPTGRRWVAVAIGAFLLSLVSSSIGFLITAVMFPRVDGRVIGDTERTLMASAVILTCAGFVAGILAMAIFFWLNW